MNPGAGVMGAGKTHLFLELIRNLDQIQNAAVSAMHKTHIILISKNKETLGVLETICQEKGYQLGKQFKCIKLKC